MLYKQRFDKLYSLVEKILDSAPGCHDFDHTKRVLHNAQIIAKLEAKSDIQIVEPAALLHDISRTEELDSKGQICHATHGALQVPQLLRSCGFTSEKIVKAIAACVRTHRYRGDNPPPETIEQKIIYDADKLDSIGAVGIGRAFHFAGRIGARLHNTADEALHSEAYSSEDSAYREYLVKLRNIPDKMLTQTGRRVAIEHATFMEKFFDKINMETCKKAPCKARCNSNGTKRVIAVGLNPAWQKTLQFDNLQCNEINRVSSITHYASGKGINFARAAKTWNLATEVFQFTGGETGKKICQYLNEEQIDHTTIVTSSPTRTCTTCLCKKTSKMTELIEPSGSVETLAKNELLESIKSAMQKATGIAICGTFPDGIDSQFYAELATEAQKQGIPILIDSSTGVEVALKNGVDILKINLAELKALTGENTLEEALSFCENNFQIDIIAITDGTDRAWLKERDKQITPFAIPKIEKIVNPLGAGDTASAVLLAEIIEGSMPNDAFATALAAASASCMTLKCAEFSKSEAKNLRKLNL